MRTQTQDASPRRGTKRGFALRGAAVLIAAAGFAALFALALLPGAHGAFEMDNTGGTAACAVGGNTFVSAASTGLRLRSAALAEIAAPELSFSSPAASGGEGGAAVWDSGGGTLCLISPEGDAIEVSAGGRVVSAEVNPGGLTAAAVLPEDGLGLVTVYSAAGAELYRCHLNTAWPLSACVSPDGEKLAILAASERGGEVRVFRLDSTEQHAAYTLPGECFFRLGWLSDGELCAVSEKRALVLTDGCEILHESVFDGAARRAEFGEGFAVIETSAGALLTLDAGGETGRRELDGAALSLDALGDRVLYLAGGEAVFCTPSLDVLASRPAEGALSALLRSRGDALLIGRAEAEVIYV